MRYLVCLLSLLWASPATAQDGFVHIVAWRDAPDRHSEPVTLGRFAGRHVKLGPRVRAASTQLYANRNDNDHFTLSVRHRSRPCENLALRVGDALLAGGGSGSGSGDVPCSASFDIDGATAARVATALGIPLHRRQPVGERVHAVFETAAHVRAGDPVVVRVRIQNPADAPAVMRVAGGRQRGPRNDRFTFLVIRDGMRVAEIPAMNFGGITGPVRLDPGGEAVLTEELGRWADVSVPGRYEVMCTYETELMPDGADFDAQTEGRVWSRVFAGTVRFTVR